MDFRTLLWKYAPKQSGECDIKVYVHHNGKKRYISTKVKIHPDHWDEKRSKVKSSHPLYLEYNTKIQSIRFEIEKFILEGGEVDRYGKNNETHQLLPDFAKQYCEEIRQGMHGIKSNTLKVYKTTLRHLQHFQSGYYRPLTFENIDLTFHKDFSEYLKRERNLKLTSIGRYIKITKRLMDEAFQRGLHKNTLYQDKRFRAHRGYESKKIYLTEEEMAKIEALDLSGFPHLEIEQERFLVAYNFLMRYTESTSLRKTDFFEKNGRKYVRIHRLKKGKESIIPVKEKTWEILEKRNFDIGADTNQESNRKLKTIGAMAGINDMVSEGEAAAPKFNFITTHTARRSAATNLYLQGVSTKLIADLGGWKSIPVLQTYLRASGLESAELAKDLTFFK